MLVAIFCEGKRKELFRHIFVNDHIDKYFFLNITSDGDRSQIDHSLDGIYNTRLP